MTPWASPSTDEMGGVCGVVQLRPSTFWYHESDREKGWGAHGTPNCCQAHGKQNL